MGSKLIMKRGRGKREMNGWDEVVGSIDWGFHGGQRFTSLNGVIRKPRWRGVVGRK